MNASPFGPGQADLPPATGAVRQGRGWPDTGTSSLLRHGRDA